MGQFVRKHQNINNQAKLRLFPLLHSYPINLKMADLAAQTKNVIKPVNIIFSLNESVGELAESLKIFKKHQVNLLGIESRSSIKVPGYEIMVEVDTSSGNVDGALEELKKESSYFQLIN